MKHGEPQVIAVPFFSYSSAEICFQIVSAVLNVSFAR